MISSIAKSTELIKRNYELKSQYMCLTVVLLTSLSQNVNTSQEEAGQLGLKSSRPASQVGLGSTRPGSTRPGVDSIVTFKNKYLVTN